MITKLALNNFKAFKRLDPVDIKPITVFCGTNSSGKSSLLQTILLWKQTLECRTHEHSILMNGRLTHLGTFFNALNVDNSNIAPMRFEFTFEFSRADLKTSGVSSQNLPPEILLYMIFPDNVDDQAIYRIRYTIELGNTGKTEITSFSKATTPTFIDLEMAVISTSLPENISKVTIKCGDDLGDFVVSWSNLLAFNTKDKRSTGGPVKLSDLGFSNLLPLQMFTADLMSPGAPRVLFLRLRDLFCRIFDSISYIGPLREEPARRYIYENEIIEIGTKGENAAFIYLTQGAKQINDHFFYNADCDNFHQISNVTLEEGVQDWLNIMGIFSFQASKDNSEVVQLTLDSNKNSSRRVNIADVGFGVSQIFPIILEGLRMNKGQTLLLEQPEIHLHPKLQMQLADYIVSLALSGKRVVLETHSDHIVNRLVRRVAEDQTGKLGKLAGIYFVKPGEEGSQVEEIEVSPTEGIINWPDEFFDQAASEQSKIMKALIANRKRS